MFVDLSQMKKSLSKVDLLSWDFPMPTFFPRKDSGANSNVIYLVVSTHLKNNSQMGLFPQVGVEIKNIWKHHL